MKTYYAQYDAWRDSDIVPTVEKVRVQAASKEEAIFKIEERNVGHQLKVRLIYALNDDSPRKKPRRSVASRLAFLVIGCIGLVTVLGRFF